MTFTYSDAVILGAIVECILYGVYVVLFILYLVLRRRNNHTVDGLLTLAQILLFGLCTLFFCLDVSGKYLQVAPDTQVAKATSDRVSAGATSLFSIIDCLAQMILLYRCWIIWDKRWAVVAIPGFLSLVSLGAGLAVVGLLSPVLPGPIGAALFTLVVQLGTAAYFISLGVNALTTLLIVTKILLISREVRPVLGSVGSHRSFRVVVAMLIESGLLIFVSQLVFGVLFLRVGAEPSAFVFAEGAITQIYGITPTLLNIRVIMGSSYDKTTRAVSSLNCAPGGAVPQTINTNPNATTIYTGGNIQLDDVPDNKSAAESSV